MDKVEHPEFLKTVKKMASISREIITELKMAMPVSIPSILK